MDTISQIEKSKYPYQQSMERLLNQYIWTHKIQACELDYELCLQKWFKIIRGVFYCASSSGVVTGICVNSQLTTLIASIITFLVSVIDVLITEGDYSVRIGKLQFISQELFHDKNELAFEIKKCELGKYTEKEIEEIYKDFLNRYEVSCRSRISESNRAMKMAEQKLKNRKDEEINQDLVDQELSR